MRKTLETSERRQRSWREKLMLGLPAATMAVLASCSNNVPHQTDQTAKKLPYVMQTPDMSGFTMPGDSSRCYSGGKRPCAVLLRAAPTVQSHYVVAIEGTSVPWPLEAYGNQAGDALKIVCQVKGSEVQDYKGDPPSDIWDVVETPVENLNPQTQSLMDKGSKTTFGVTAKKTAIYAYASTDWFGQFGRAGLLGNLAPCTQQENPAGYPPVK